MRDSWAEYSVTVGLLWDYLPKQPFLARVAVALSPQHSRNSRESESLESHSEAEGRRFEFCLGHHSKSLKLQRFLGLLIPGEQGRSARLWDELWE